MLEESPDDGNTALHWLMKSKKSTPALQEIILRNFVSSNKTCSPRNRIQETPLHLAILNGKSELVRILIQHGADLMARDCLDRTPFEVAKEFDQQSIVAALQEAETLQPKIPRALEHDPGQHDVLQDGRRDSPESCAQDRDDTGTASQQDTNVEAMTGLMSDLTL